MVLVAVFVLPYKLVNKSIMYKAIIIQRSRPPATRLPAGNIAMHFLLYEYSRPPI